MLNQNSILSSNTSGSGSADGDVIGPASSTDNAVVRYNGTTGKLVQNSTVVIEDGGNVGIGTTAPEHKLSVFDASSGNRTEVGIDNVDQRLVLGAYFETGVTQYSTIQATNNAESSGTNLALQPDGGNVGIGTASPTDKLHVNGPLRVDSWIGGNSSTGELSLYGDREATQGVTILDSGNVGIGTASPAAAGAGKSTLDVNGPVLARGGVSLNQTSAGGLDFNSNDLRIRSWGATAGTGSMSFRTGGGGGSLDSEAMRITSSGRVGIGLAAPQGHLHINTESAEATEVYVDGVNNQQKSVELRHYDASDASGAGRNTFYLKTKAADAVTLGGYDNSSSEFEVVTFQENGYVGINDSSPSYQLDVNGTGRFTSTVRFDGVTQNYNGAYDINRSGGGFLRHRTADQPLYIGVTNTSGVIHYPIVLFASNDVLQFNNEEGEMARFDTSGNFIIGDTAVPSGTTNAIAVADATYKYLKCSKDSTASRYQIQFLNPNGLIGSVTTTNSATAYNTSSDYRLKENVVPMQDALQRITQLKPSRFNFIADDSVVVDGFIAHEVQEHVPEAISGEKDAMKDEEYEVTPAVLDDDGNEITPAVMDTRSVPEYQGIDQSKLVPLLVGAIQELTARIAALENS